MRQHQMETPIGPLALTLDGDVLVEVQFGAAAPDRPGAAPVKGGAVVDRLTAYFAGDLDSLADIAVRFDRGTGFQREVWNELTKIPLAETISYGELAARLGRPAAFRAVGAANGRNPIAVVVPCHRVINSGGGLGGYAGGLPTKQWLLDHERGAADEQALLPGMGLPGLK